MAEQIIQQGIIVGRTAGAAITVVPTTDGISKVAFDNRSGGQISDIQFDHATNTMTMNIGGVTQLQATSTGITIGGDFHVDGTTTTTDSVDLVISDNIILLNNGEAGAGVGNGTGNAGIQIDRGTLDDAGWFYNEAQDWWGPTGPSGTFGAGIGATQTVGNITTIDFTSAVDQVLTIASTGALTIPKGSNALRPGGVAGMIRFNNTTDVFEAYDGFNWGQVIATVPGTPTVFTGDIDLGNTYRVLRPLDPTADDEVGDRLYNDNRYLQITNNLSDIDNPATARANLGLSATALDAVDRAGDTMYGSLIMGDGSDIEVTADSVAVAGTGYSVDDTLTIAGGTFTTPLIVKVISIGVSGEVVTFVKESKGVYSVAPSSPATTTGGTGTGATFNITTATPAVDIIPYEDYATAANPRDIGKSNGVDGYAGIDQRFRSIHAETFHGVATSALYADLAERYEADNEYDEGTVVVFGGEKEITLTETMADTSVAGIISVKPAFKMNSGAGDSDTHPYVALKGKVPCKIIGPVRKGELLITSNIPGYATSSGSTASPYTAFARALEHFNGYEGVIYVSMI